MSWCLGRDACTAFRSLGALPRRHGVALHLPPALFINPQSQSESFAAGTELLGFAKVTAIDLIDSWLTASLENLQPIADPAKPFAASRFCLSRIQDHLSYRCWPCRDRLETRVNHMNLRCLAWGCRAAAGTKTSLCWFFPAPGAQYLIVSGGRRYLVANEICAL